MTTLSQRLMAEALGTYALIFACTGASVVDQLTHGSITHLGSALTSGLIVMVLIYAFGDLSGAHLNPAVTICFTASGRFPLRELTPYMGAQAVGAFLASTTIRLLFPSSGGIGITKPSGSDLQSFVMEFLLTAFLMIVVLNVSHGAKEKGITAGIAVGATIGVEILVAGPISGASMNPIRSLAPALVSGHYEHLWIYLSAPVLGALIALPLFVALRKE
jgi:aquaporin NIP